MEDMPLVACVKIERGKCLKSVDKEVVASVSGDRRVNGETSTLEGVIRAPRDVLECTALDKTANRKDPTWATSHDEC